MRRVGTRLTVATDAHGGFRGPVLVRDDGPVAGPVIVLVHGFSGSHGWFDDVAARLTDTVRVIRADLLGHGGTGGPAADAPLQAAVLEAVLDRLGVRRGATVAGHSFGADVAVELAERSSRVARVAVLAQAPDYDGAVFPRGNELMTHRLPAAVLHGGGQLASRALGGVLRVRPPKDPRTRALSRLALADFRAVDTGMFRVVLADRRARLDRRPLDAQIADSGKPALAVLGSDDHFYGDRAKDRYAAAGADVHVLPTGHSVQVEAPDDVARLLREFASAGVQA